MTQNSALEALPIDAPFLFDFAQLACRPAWEAWQQAKQKLDAAGGEFKAGEQSARLHRSTRRSSYRAPGCGWPAGTPRAPAGSPRSGC